MFLQTFFGLIANIIKITQKHYNNIFMYLYYKIGMGVKSNLDIKADLNLSFFAFFVVNLVLFCIMI